MPSPLDVTDAEVLKRQPATMALLALQIAAAGVEVGWPSLRRHTKAHQDALLMLVGHARGQHDQRIIRAGLALDRYVLEVVDGFEGDGDSEGWATKLQQRITELYVPLNATTGPTER